MATVLSPSRLLADAKSQVLSSHCTGSLPAVTQKGSATKLAIRCRPHWWSTCSPLPISQLKPAKTSKLSDDVRGILHTDKTSNERHGQMTDIMTSLTGAQSPRLAAKESPTRRNHATMIYEEDSNQFRDRVKLPIGIREVIEQIDQISECMSGAIIETEKFGKSVLSRVLRKTQTANEHQVHTLVAMLLKERKLRVNQDTVYREALSAQKKNWEQERELLRDALGSAQRNVLAKDAMLRVERLTAKVTTYGDATNIEDRNCHACKQFLSHKRKKKSRKI